MEHHPSFRTVLDSLYDGVYITDTDRTITFWNQSAERLTGYSSAEVVGLRCADNVLVHVDEAGVSLCTGACPIVATLLDGESRQTEVYLHHKDGHRLPVLVRTAPLRDEVGAIVGAVEVFSDNSPSMTIRHRLEQLEKLALLDELTGIPNRRFLEQEMEGRASELIRYGRPFGVLFFDIDNFKDVNDTHGHETGDRVLRMVAQTLMHSSRPFDLAGRWGGEEFLCIVVGADREGLLASAERLRLLVEASALERAGGRISVTVSVGGTMSLPRENTVSVVSRADGLLYSSKQAGRNRVTIA